MSGTVTLVIQFAARVQAGGAADRENDLRRKKPAMTMGVVVGDDARRQIGVVRNSAQNARDQIEADIDLRKRGVES